MVLRSQHHRDRFQDERLSFQQQHPVCQNSVLSSTVDQRKVTHSHMQNAAASFLYAQQKSSEMHTILNNSRVREMQFQETYLIDFSAKYPGSCEVLLLSYHFVDVFINIPPADSGLLSRNKWQINESRYGLARTLSPSSPSTKSCWLRIPPRTGPNILDHLFWRYTNAVK